MALEVFGLEYILSGKYEDYKTLKYPSFERRSRLMTCIGSFNAQRTSDYDEFIENFCRP